MKKLMTIVAIVVVSMMVCSCKNSCKKAECTECTDKTECCCCEHAEGECTKAEGEKCEKCLEKAAQEVVETVADEITK